TEEPKGADIRHWPPRPRHKGPIERRQHGGQAAEMVEMGMPRHDRRQLGGTMTPQEWHHDPAAGISLRSPRPAIDQQPPTGWTAQGNRVTLADVKETYGKAMTV